MDEEDVHYSKSTSWCTNMFFKKRRKDLDSNPVFRGVSHQLKKNVSVSKVSCFFYMPQSMIVKLVWNVKKYGDFWQRQLVQTVRPDHFNSFVVVSTGGPRYL